MKYIIKYTSQYTNEVVYIEANSMVEFAVKYMDFDLIQNERCGWMFYYWGKKLPTIQTNGQGQKC